MSLAAALAVGGAVTGAATLAHAGTPDTQPPTIAGYRVLPTTVDDTAGDTTATVVVRIRDAAQPGATAAGFSNGTVTLSTSTSTLPTVGFTDSDRVSGTPFDGTYDVDVSVAQGTPAGSYTASIYLEDFAGADITTTNATALQVLRANDTTAPALASFTAGATGVDVTAGDRSVTFTARLTDAQSGTRSARLALAGPNGASDVVDFDRTSGSAQNGVWTAVERFAVGGSPGAWSATGLTLADAFANTTTVTTGLGAANIAVTATADTTAPTLASLTLDRTDVDVSDGPKNVRATITAGDDLSGVDTGHLTFTGDDGYSTVEADLSDDPVAGSTLDGTWTADVPFDTAGTFTLTEVTLTDAQGNLLTLCTPGDPADPYDQAPDADCDGPQPTVAVTVSATPDTVGPTATNFRIGPATSTAGYQGAARIDGSFTVADATSGFGGGTVTLVNGSDSVPVFVSSYDLVSGTLHSGTVEFSTYLDASQAGTWTVQSLEVDDAAGNSTSYASGLGSVSVVTTRNDTAGPALTSVTATPNPVTTIQGPQPVTVNAAVTDTQANAIASGVSDVTLTLAAPSGARTDVDLDTLVAGNAVTGTWSGTTTIGQFAEAGTWTVVAAAVTDAAGHETDYAAGAAPLTGGSFRVNSAVDPTAPVVTGLSVPSPTLDAAGADRSGVVVPVHVAATDTGAGIDDIAVTLAGPGGQQRSATVPVDNATTATADVLVTVPSFNSTGTWSVSNVDVLSDHGPDARWTAADLAQHDLTTSFVLTAPSDTTGPTVTGLTVTPNPVDTSTAPVAADVLVHLCDAGVGVDHGWVTLTSPKGYQTLSTALTRVAGDAGDGWWQGSIALPRYVDGGAWRIAVSAVDALGNGADASGATLTNAGLPATITVTGLADTTAPRATTLTLGRSTVDSAALSSGSWLTIATTAADDDSGVAAVEVTITAPNGLAQTVTGSPVASSSPAAASYVAAVPLASLRQVGTWQVSSVAVRDLAGNSRTYTAPYPAGWSSSFTVQGPLPGAPPTTTDPPPVPGNVTAILAGTTSATVSWTAPSSTVAGYTVTPYRDGTAQATVAAASTSATFAGLARGSAYTFVVRAYNDSGTSEPSVPSVSLVVPAVAPSAPSIQKVTPAGPGVVVAFGAPADDGGATVTSYTVTPCSDGEAGAPVTVPASAHSASVTGLQRGLTYTFTVTAANNKGTSPAATSVPVALPVVAPSAPAGVSAVLTGTSAQLSWSAPLDDGGADVTSYVVTPSTGAPVSVDAGSTHATVTGLPAGRTITFAVIAVNTAGRSTAATTTVATAGAAQARTALRITAMPAALIYGATLPVTGRLTRTDTDAPLAGRAVQLQFRRHGVGAYVAFGSARTTTNGVVTFATFRPGWSVDVRLVTAADPAFAAATSAVRTAAEYARISISAPARTSKGRTFAVVGAVTPGKARHVVYLQRRSGSRWVTVSRQALSSRSGYRFTVKARNSSSYRVYYAADGYQTTTVSATRIVRVS